MDIKIGDLLTYKADGNEDWILRAGCHFSADKSYKVVRIQIINGGNDIPFINLEDNFHEEYSFNYNFIYTYFYSKQEERKLKLDKIC